MNHLAEHVHLLRALVWPALGLYIVLFNPTLAQSVGLVIALSLYANFAGDISAWQSARTERRMSEDSAE